MKKRSVNIEGHQTSITLEQEFLDELQRIAHEKSLSLNKLVGDIDAKRAPDQNLSSAIRLFILQDLRANR